MKKSDIIILSYGAIIFLDMIFLILANRFDILLISGPVSLIPFVFALKHRGFKE